MPAIINLIFHNESEFKQPPRIVLFQKHMIGAVQGDPVAWKVFTNLGVGDYHPFQFAVVLQMSVIDSSGTQIGPLVDVPYSQSYMVKADVAQITTVPLTVPLINGFKKGSIRAEIFRGGNLLAVTTHIRPEESVIFQFDQVLWLGLSDTIHQGHIMRDITQARFHTGVNLAGINTAEIVMTGGVVQPLAFNLRNVT